MRIAVKHWLSHMDNGLFELLAPSASSMKDAGAERSRRDRNDEDFGALVRAGDTRAERAEATTPANPGHRDSGNEQQRDNSNAFEAPRADRAAREQSDRSFTEPQQQAEPQRQADATPSDPEARPQAAHDQSDQTSRPTELPTDIAVPASLPEPASATAVGVLQALIAGQPTPAPAASARPTSAEFVPPAAPPALDALAAAGPSPSANADLPDVVDGAGPSRAAPLAGVLAPLGEQTAPTPTPPQPTSADALTKPNLAAETAANSAQIATGSTTDLRPEPAAGLQNAEARIQTAATHTPPAGDTPMDAPETLAATPALSAAATALRQTNGRENGQVNAADDKPTDTTRPAAPLASAASAAANARPTTTGQNPSNTAANPGQQRAANAGASANAGSQGPNAPANDQASAVREMALALAADRLVPGHALRSGDAAPDLAVFRETLATVLPDTGGAQMAENIRAAGRIVAANLGARAPMPHPSLTDQVSIRIREAFDAGDSQVRIQLQPKELGRIDVRLDIHESGRMSALVVAERADTLELLMRDARGLERALQQAGFDTDSNSLAFDLQEQEQQAGHQNSDGEIGEQDTAPGDIANTDEINIDLAALMRGDPSTSGVDIRV